MGVTDSSAKGCVPGLKAGAPHWERGHPSAKNTIFCLNHDEKDLMITMIKKSFPSFNQVNQGSDIKWAGWIIFLPINSEPRKHEMHEGHEKSRFS